jgi:predicted permease
MLLRSTQREREVAVRLALGARRRHLARMLLTETSLICAAAVGTAVGVTAFLLATIAPLIETQLGRPAPSASGIAIDRTVLFIVGAIGLLVAVALSLAPLRSWGRGLTHAMQQDGRVASGGPSMRRLRSGLIAFEIAGSLVLLVGCGLMIRSVVTMMATDLGFDADGLTSSRVMLRARNYPDPAAYRLFHERFARRLSAVTGSPVVFSSWPPFVAAPSHLIEPDAGDAGVSAGAIAVSAGYFSTFGINIRQGREFSTEEASADAPVAVISETLARLLWPAGNALGRRVRAVERTQGGSNAGPWRTVVGIAGDVRQGYSDTHQGDFYTPRTPDGRFGSFYVRTHRPAPLLLDSFRSAVGDIDREAVISLPRLVADGDQQLKGTRFLTFLMTGFAAIAAFLAMLGIYGVTAYAVQQRRKEVAIRVALGASGRAIVRMFVRDGALLLGAGTAVGLVGGATLSRVLRNQIFGVQSFDVSTYVIASALLLVAGFAAVFWAARRAAVAHPVSALNAS